MPAAVAPLPMVSRSMMPTLIPASASSLAQAAPTMPAPTISASKVLAITNTPAERIALVEQQAAFKRNERPAGDAGPYLAIDQSIRGLEAIACRKIL